MKRHIHTQIFFTTLLIILFLTGGSWLVFSVTSEQYIKNMTEWDARNIIRMVETSRQEIYEQAPALSERSREEERTYSRELLKAVKQQIRRQGITGRLLVFNSKLRQVYPGTSDSETVSDDAAQTCLSMLTNGALRSGEGTWVHIGDADWYIQLFTLETKHNVRANYFLAAVPSPDITIFWHYTGRLLTVITAAAIGLAAVFIGLAARSISRPLRQLCFQAQAIGEGKGAPIQEHYTLTELETLKETYNQMEEKLRESREAKDQFFQNISHDLRTPLASITGYAQGIQCGVMKDPQKAAEVILSESIRMTNLVESILTLTKIDNHEWKLQTADIDLETFLEEQIESLRGLAKECRLRLISGNEGLSICTDPELLGRMIQNVVSNCIRYAREEILIHIRQAGDLAVIEVMDDGYGFDDEALCHAFERFYHGKNGNSGIGLSIVWSGMQYLDGYVEIGNREPPEHGAIYRLFLPFRGQTAV